MTKVFMPCANFPAARGGTEDAENESKKSSVNSAASVVNYPYGTFLVAAQPHWGLIVLAFPGGEDGSRPERKKF
jgi:hypothetical protein